MEEKPDITNNMHKSKRMEILQSGVTALYQDKLLFDVQLQAEGKIFSAHRAILSAVSEYFRAMFTGGYKESRETEKPIVLKGISASGLKVVLDCVYTTEANLTTENILETIPVACMLQIQTLIEECEEFLLSSICADMIFVYAEIAERFSLKRASECFADYKKACFPEISQTLAFKELDVEEVVGYLSIPDLFLHGQEMTAFDAAIGWLEHKPEQRKKHVLDVFRCINLLQIPESEITDKVRKVKLIMENSACEGLVREALQYHEETFMQPFYKGRIINTRGVTDGIVAFPWFEYPCSYKLTVEDVPNYREIFGELYPDLAIWRYLSIEDKRECKIMNSSISGNRIPADFAPSKKPEFIDIHDLIKIGNFLFLFNTGVRRYDYPSNVALRYNPIVDQWVTLTPAPFDPSKNKYVYARCSDKHIILVGAEDYGFRIKPESTFYFIYSVADDEWRQGEAQLDLQRDYGPKAVYQNGNLYIADEKNLFSYDMENDTWSHEFSFPLSAPSTTYSTLVGHDKSLFFLLPSFDETSCMEYNLETKSAVMFSNPMSNLNVLVALIIRAFTHGEYVYAVVDRQRCIELYRFDPVNKYYTFVRSLPCYLEKIHAVPMILPRF